MTDYVVRKDKKWKKNLTGFVVLREFKWAYNEMFAIEFSKFVTDHKYKAHDQRLLWFKTLWIDHWWQPNNILMPRTKHWQFSKNCDWKCSQLASHRLWWLKIKCELTSIIKCAITISNTFQQSTKLIIKNTHSVSLCISTLWSMQNNQSKWKVHDQRKQIISNNVEIRFNIFVIYSQMKKLCNLLHSNFRIKPLIHFWIHTKGGMSLCCAFHKK